MDTHNQRVRDHFNQKAALREKFRLKNWYYHLALQKLCSFFIPPKMNVLQVGSSTGDLLAAVNPAIGIGVDIAEEMVEKARKKYPKLKFIQSDIQNLSIHGQFDYIICSDLIGHLSDVQKTFEKLHNIATDDSRIIITYYNFLWEPILILAEKLGFKSPNPTQNWLSLTDIQNLLDLTDLEVVKKGNYLLLPVFIPVISDFVNKYIGRMPLIKQLCLVQYVVARKNPGLNKNKDYKVSIIIPARNEEGNIEAAVKRTPHLGSWDELVFVEGNSSDNTKREIERVMEKYKSKRNIVLVNQGKGKGKGDAVRKGFAKARGDILMILDADLTMPPEDLPKYYQAIKNRVGEFVMGSRLVYPMEDQAMRFLNILGNKFFSLVFSFLLDQKVKDTLCGTKVLFKKDYEAIVRNRSYFGDFDPFGDFDLIFGAAKQNLKIVEIPVRYKARTYGTTNISRFKHGFLLLKMVLFASRKIKFI